VLRPSHVPASYCSIQQPYYEIDVMAGRVRLTGYMIISRIYRVVFGLPD
jgi:hypothetical protein